MILLYNAIDNIAEIYQTKNSFVFLPFPFVSSAKSNKHISREMVTLTYIISLYSS